MTRSMAIVVLVAGVLYSSAMSATQEPVDTAFLSAMTYRSVGPHRGGRVTAVAGVPDEPFLFYMGTTGGGVFKTDDAGESWTSITDGQFGVGTIGAIAVAPSDANVIYVGTGSAETRGNTSPGIGMYRSTDATSTHFWRKFGSLAKKLDVSTDMLMNVSVAKCGQTV